MLITLVSGCANSATSITGTELTNQIATGNTPLILDTRSRYEYENGHLPGAVFFPFWKAFFADDSILERCKTEPIVVYCQHGPRASFAGFALRQSGCTNVLELEGHMAGWKEQGRPVIAVLNENDNTANQEQLNDD